MAVLDAPLQLADPHRHPRQLGGVFVELDAEHVVRAGDVVLALQAELLGLEVGAVLDVLQRLQRQVEEVAAAAGRVEHAVGLELLEEADEHRLRVAPGLVAVALAARQRGGDARHPAGPCGEQGALHHRLHEPGDGGRIGVVRAELAALGRVQPALEQRAEDAGVDGAPVQAAGGAQRGQVVGGQGRHVDGGEQATVEPGHVVHAEQAAALHRGKERTQLRAQPLGRHPRLHQAFEEPAGQQAHVFGEEAEHALGEEVAHLRRRHAGGAQPLCAAGEGARGGLGDVAVGLARPVLLGREPQRAQALAHLGPGDVLQRKGVALAGRAGEVGVDLDALAVADDEQRRALQRQRVHHELPERALQAAPRGLVFPGEVAAQPDVGKAVGARTSFQDSATGLAHAALEAVALGVGRLGHAEHAAQVDEMGLRAGAFAQRVRR